MGELSPGTPTETAASDKQGASVKIEDPKPDNIVESVMVLGRWAYVSSDDTNSDMQVILETRGQDGKLARIKTKPHRVVEGCSVSNVSTGQLLSFR